MQIPKSDEGLCPFEPHLKGDTPLKSLLCVRFSPQGAAKNHWFFAGFFVFFNLAQFHYNYFNTFAQVMVSKASATNYDAKRRH